MKIVHFDEIDSTNKYAKEHANELANLSFVSCDFQTKGKGRNDHVWDANKNESVLFSFVIKDKEIIDRFNELSLYVPYILMNFFISLGIENVYLKWPNDIYIKDKKIVGILLESNSQNNAIETLIVGVGININQTSFSASYKATSLKLEANKDFNIVKLRKKIFKTIIKGIKDFKKNKKDYLSYLKEKNYLKDKEVYALYLGEKIKVTVIDLNDDCSLKVKYNDEILNINAGEISFH